MFLICQDFFVKKIIIQFLKFIKLKSDFDIKAVKFLRNFLMHLKFLNSNNNKNSIKKPYQNIYPKFIEISEKI